MRRICYWFLLAMIFTIPWADLVTLPGLGSASRAMGILASAVWLLTVLVTGKFRRLGAFHLLAFLFFLWNAASVLWSIDPARTLTQVFTYVQMAVFSLMLWDLSATRATIKASLQAYVLGLTVPIVSTVSSYLANVGTEYELYGRYSAAGNNANTTAIILAMGLPLAFYLAATAANSAAPRLWRTLNYAYVPAIMFAIILTATRFAIFMAVPAFAFGLITLTSLKPIPRFVILGLLVAAALNLSSRVPEATLQRIATAGDEIQAGDLNDRVELWGRGLDIWLEHPLLGTGAAGYNAAVAPIYGRPRAAHNSFVAVASELGIVGIGLFGLIVVAALLQAGGHARPLDTYFWLAVLATWGLGNLALTWTYSKPTWLLLTLLAASASVSLQTAESAAAGRPVIEPTWLGEAGHSVSRS